MTWTEALAIGQFIILIASIVGGFLGLRATLVKSEASVQERIRQALHDENELLQSQVVRLEKELRRVQALMRLLIETLDKYRGIKVEMDNDSITVRNGGGQTLIAHLPQDSQNGP